MKLITNHQEINIKSMIKFFRTIRKTLIMENKTSKYLKYAIGEIVLVVVGILIALQINNWNENRKLRNLENKLLSMFQTTIAQDTADLHQEGKWFDEILIYSDFIKTKFKDNSAYEKRLDTAFAAISTFNIAESDYTPYEELKSVGLNIITNDSLRKYMVKYYEHSKHLQDTERYFENGKYFRREIYPKYFSEYQYGRIAVPVNYEALKANNEFLIALDYCINDAKFYRRWSLHRLEDARFLLKEIKNELNQ